MRTLPSLLLLSALCPIGAWAGGNASSASALASISIVRPIVLTNLQDLYFGALLVEPNSPGGTIEQNAASGGGTRVTDPAGITQVALSTDHWHNAEFEIQGEPGANFSVYLPKGTLQITANGASLPVTGLNYYTDSAIATSGSTRMWIGGRLVLPVNPAPGHYSALFPVTVAYY